MEVAEAVALLADRPIHGMTWSATGERLAVSWGPPSALASHSIRDNRAGQSGENLDKGVVSLMLIECDGRDQHLRAVCECKILCIYCRCLWDSLALLFCVNVTLDGESHGQKC